jgi:hypothetical protein
MASSYRSCTPLLYLVWVQWRSGASPGAGIMGATRTSSSTATLSQTSGALPGATSPSNFGGNRDKAAARLSVDRPVLSTIGKLTAREDPVHGRAYGKAGGAAGPLTEAEVKWLEAVTPRLIRRAAEYEARVPSLPQITMADLPPLSD